MAQDGLYLFRRPWHKEVKAKEDAHYNQIFPDSKGHGANMWPTWGWQDPGGPHVGHMNLVIWKLLWNILIGNLVFYPNLIDGFPIISSEYA